MIIGELFGLIGNRFGDLRAAIPDIHTIKPRKSIKHTVAITVLNVAARARFDHTLRQISARKFRKMCGGVKEVFTVPLFELVVVKHGSILKAYAARRVSK